MFTLEIIASTPKDVINAQQNGADRIELVTGLSEGGLTPSIGLIEEAKKVATVPIMVMVRPRGGDFCYDELEIEAIFKDIKTIKELGLHGIVIGILDKEKNINTVVLKKILSLAEGLDITFNRAFDASRDVYKSAEIIKQLGIKRVLTSGQAENSFLGLTTFKKIHQQFSDSLNFMPGVGLDSVNLLQLLNDLPPTKEYHLGLGVRENKNPLSPVRGELVSKARNVLDNYFKSGEEV